MALNEKLIGKDVEGSRRGAVEVLSQYLPEGMKTHVKP
jgi:hypothetical protein